LSNYIGVCWRCRSADERTARDGVRRPAVGPVSGVNGSITAVKRLFTDDDDDDDKDAAAATAAAGAAPSNDVKRRRATGDSDAQLYTLEV